MSRFAKTLAICAVGALIVAAPASAGPPEATAAGNCSVRGKERTMGASYVTKLSTRNVSCRNARGLTKRYHRCRFRNGGRKGRCRGLEGFRCEERRYNRIDISFDANVLCKKGSKRVRHTYTQLT
jgi:hypothetical protein